MAPKSRPAGRDPLADISLREYSAPMHVNLRPSDWATPYRQSAYWIITAFISFAIVSAVFWFGGFVGVVVVFPFAVVLGVLWLVVAALGLKVAWRKRHKLRDALIAGTAPFAAFALAIALALPVMWGVAWCLDWTSFLSNRSEYAEIVRLVEAGTFDGPAEGFQENNGITFMIDEGRPLRVAFLMPGGFLDNWSGVIYDPTGDVMLAHGWNAQTGVFVAPERVTKLFYGDLVSCRHLSGKFYQCSFT